ncbi:6-phosphogluconolactonase [Pricia antarctica]|uniref:6-phosphogluconolactonase n=1 Tax=Pricia antarctica TaxID=641691 RepID=A0A1G7CRH5_9FLAO|nr:beta-propeller fold lactonase family protein [Pricia antarctica]SDE41952.1 6-phosphogluconolactonase [Pricia antarctica]
MKTTLFLSLILCFPILVERQTAVNDTIYNLLVGTYTQSGKSDGIYVYRFNIETGEFSYGTEAAGIKNPSYLTVSKDGKFV